VCLQYQGVASGRRRKGRRLPLGAKHACACYSPFFDLLVSSLTCEYQYAARPTGCGDGDTAHTARASARVLACSRARVLACGTRVVLRVGAMKCQGIVCVSVHERIPCVCVCVCRISNVRALASTCAWVFLSGCSGVRVRVRVSSASVFVSVSACVPVHTHSLCIEKMHSLRTA